MSFVIKFSNESQLDLKEANAYYVSVSTGLSTKFQNDVIETIDRISINPENF